MSDFFSGQGDQRGGGLAGGLSSGMKMAAVALLVQQLMKYARTQPPEAGGYAGGGAAPGGQGEAGQGGGSVGDVLGGLLRGGPAATGNATPAPSGGGFQTVPGGNPLPPYSAPQPGQAAPAGGGLGQGQGGGLADVLGGLLGGGAAAGGLGSILGSVLGGGAGAGRMQSGGGLGGMGGNAGLGGLLGGLAGMLGGMRRQGFADEVDSWVAPGANREIPMQAVEREFDLNEIDRVAAQLGTDRQTLLEELRHTMPEMVDRLTPQGHVPQQEDELGQGGVGELLGSLLRPAGPPRA